jgi:hypothetical protein
MTTADSESSYRELVKRYLKNGPLSADDREALELDRAYLKLSPDQAEEIEQEISASINKTPRKTTQQLPAQPTSNSVSNPEAEQAPIGSDRPELPAASQPSPNLSQGDTPVGEADSKSPAESSPQAESDPVGANPPAETVKPSDPDYAKRLQQYEDEFFKAVRSGRFREDEKTREYLNHELPEKLQLTPPDANEARNRANERLLNSSRQPQSPPPKPIFNDQDRQKLADLEKYLRSETRNLQEADQITAQLLQKIIAPAPEKIDYQSLRKVVAELRSDEQRKQAIREVNRLWHEHSNGKFGFSRQLAIYRRDSKTADEVDDAPAERIHVLQFIKDVGWWIRGLEFFKPYSCLDFSTDAPAGHLPALWFWQLPLGEPRRQGNLGLFADRSGCRLDTDTIPTFMLMLSKCGLPEIKSKPSPVESPPTPPVERGNRNTGLGAKGKRKTQIGEPRRKNLGL